ncbi:hypothetical protein BCV71DRAFT_94576 [Rhizopus microsporus]|uniref:Uncharacterized protein n=1 Tax=Rhizopus microsporus TaxID=58291 RepID=A0A1X0RK15_RHIZD|nr:hypothetical protein BCV71DRAFT_94576 [Rhizopus microsporus]
MTLFVILGSLSLVLILIKRLYRDSLTYTSLVTFNCSDQYFSSNIHHIVAQIISVMSLCLQALLYTI